MNGDFPFRSSYHFLPGKKEPLLAALFVLGACRVRFKVIKLGWRWIRARRRDMSLVLRHTREQSVIAQDGENGNLNPQDDPAVVVEKVSRRLPAGQRTRFKTGRAPPREKPDSSPNNRICEKVKNDRPENTERDSTAGATRFARHLI